MPGHLSSGCCHDSKATGECAPLHIPAMTNQVLPGICYLTIARFAQIVSLCPGVMKA